MKKKPKIIAVFISYKAAGTLAKFWADFPKKYFDEIILTDDASDDKTFQIAQKLAGLTAYQNSVNLGYGSNLKKALSLALGRGADIIVDIHPDGEYKPSAIPPALDKIQKEGYEFVLGNRFYSISALIKNGMYLWKLVPSFLLSFLDRLLLGIKLTDFHQGFRVYTKCLLERINWQANSNSYLFSFELICQAVYIKARIAQVPVETCYRGKKRGATLKASFKYSLGTLKVLFFFFLAKAGLKIPIFQKP